MRASVGFGASYTDFRYADVKLSATELPKDLTASVIITNTGRAAGREVVRRYLLAPGKAMPKPALELRGSRRRGCSSPASPRPSPSR
jgi:beta-glucosidase